MATTPLAEKTLHVAAAYSNPCRWKTRRELFVDFRNHMEKTEGVELHAGELVVGESPFEVTTAADAQFRCSSVLFHKENILNEVIKRFPPDWEYGAYVDGDFSFVRRDWAPEALLQLQHHPFVQLFSQYTGLTAKGPGGARASSAGSLSFAATWIDNGHKLPSTAVAGGWSPNVSPNSGGPLIPLARSAAAAKPAPAWIPVGATGGAWAFTRKAYETVGGLMEHCILGHADWFMAFGLVSQPTRGIIALSNYHPNYTAMIDAWQTKARALNSDIGVVDGFAVHHFHGDVKKRGYETRDQILVDYKFDPIADLRRNAQGIFELTGNKPGLRDAIRRYFFARDEDSRP